MGKPCFAYLDGHITSERGRMGISSCSKGLCYNRAFNTIGAVHKRKRFNKRMRRNSHLSQLWIVVLALLAAGCGGSSSNSTSTAPLTGLNKRVLVSNVQNGTINFVDAQKDVLNSKTLAGTSVTKMITAGGTTIGMDSVNSEIVVIDNPTETVTFNAAIGDQPFDIALSPDGKTAWAAMRNFGFVQSVDTTTGIANPVFRLANARRLVMSPNGTKLLIFLDPQANISPKNTFLVLDTATNALTSITNVAMDQPFTAVFGSSDTQAFVLNCGPECGGSTASVVSVDFTTVSSPVFSSVLVPGGATVGVLNGTTLFVAGTPIIPVAGCPLSRCGVLTAINTTALTAGAPVPITDGLHENIAITSTGKVYVGAGGCSVVPGTALNTTRGCLSIFNTTSLATSFPEESSFRQNFSVTSLQPISGRSVIYVVQGGELDIFDANTDALETGITQIDIVGNAVAAVLIDP
jgi:hypothetical protein